MADYPLGSNAFPVFDQNVRNLDKAVNDRSSRSWDDRFGVARKTWWGMEQDFQDFLINSGYQNIGDYGPGLEITARNQIFWKDGELYRAGAALELPYTTTGAWGDEESLFTLVNDRNSIDIESVQSLISSPRYSDSRFFVRSYHQGVGAGGGSFYWDESQPKENHDGGTIIDPDKRYPSDWSSQSELMDWFSPSEGGNGCFIRVNEGVMFSHDFGAIGDGVFNDSIPIQAALNWARKGNTLDFSNGEYNLEISENSRWCLFVDSPTGMRLLGNSALFKVQTSQVRASVFSIKNPNDVFIDGLFFTNPGFNIRDTVGGGNNRVGTYGIYFWADKEYSEDKPCGNIYVRGGAKDCIGFVTFSAEPSAMGGVNVSPFSISNAEIVGECERVYYGVSSMFQGKNIRVKLNCVDVRRGVISYSMKDAEININLRCNPGFIGSNAFVSLASEGRNITINGTEINGDAGNIDVRVSVSGVESHENIVTFYHQQDQPTGSIYNVRSVVTMNNMTVTGKDPSMVPYPLYAYRFLHSLPNGATVSPTTREYVNLELECKVVGGISGGSYRISSSPSVKKSISFGPEFFDRAPDGDQKLIMWILFNVKRGRQSSTFTPLVYGTSVEGQASYSNRVGRVTYLDGVAYFNIVLGWTSHTGTGNIRVGSLPAPVTEDLRGIARVSISAYGSSAFGNNNFGIIGGSAGITITPYKIEQGASAQITIPNSGNLNLSGQYPLY